MHDSVLLTASVYEKIKLLQVECHELLLQPKPILIPQTPARDLVVKPRQLLPPRIGLQTAEGQARLLHDLANIELQAMEMGVRTLREFVDAPKEFRKELAAITIDEGRHLSMCLEGIKQLGFQWGAWPVHTQLWDATSSQDTLLERIFIVHCYLEGSGLDSGEMILQKLSGVKNKIPRDIVKIIAEEEVGHVRFGLKWFREIAQLYQSRNVNFDFDVSFKNHLNHLKNRVPHRSAKISISTRQRAGFSLKNIEALEKN